MTDIERAVWYALLRAGLPSIHNYTGFGVAQPDFYLERYRTVIEVDGEYWHNTAKQKQRDAIKDKFYRSMNLRVFRITGTEAKRDPDRAIRRMCFLFRIDPKLS